MFQPQDFNQAKQQVVGNCNDIPMEQRWENETPIFVRTILKNLPEGAKTILDYGCGTGRLAKPILETNRDITVIGVDNSQEMLNEAKNYVLSNRFIPKLTNEFNDKVDFAYCVYVFQHIPALELRDSIKQVADATDKILLVNSVARMAVKGDGFENDGISVLDEVTRFFPKVRWGLAFKYINENPVMRKMFLEGDTLHYSVICGK